MMLTNLKRESKDKIERAISVLKVDLANGHDFVSAAEIIARSLHMTSMESFMFRKIASSLRLEETIEARLSKGTWA